MFQMASAGHLIREKMLTSNIVGGNLTCAGSYPKATTCADRIGMEYSLDELLAQCKPEAMVLDDEDRKWLNDVPKGREIL